MDMLKGSQRKYLRGLAHNLKPVVQVGKQGLTAGLAGSVHQALLDHELIKIKFLEFKEEKKQMAGELAARTGSECVGLIGNVATFYRPHPEEEKRQIRLPA
jgi:RNA-binding protein